RFGMSGGDTALFDAVERALDAITAGSPAEARERTLAGAWQLVDALGFGPAILGCIECGAPIGDEDAALFNHAAGGVLCARCASLSSGGRTLPAAARGAIASWLGGELAPSFCDDDARAHQRLLREFLGYHLHDGAAGARALCAYELWERGGWTAA